MKYVNYILLINYRHPIYINLIYYKLLFFNNLNPIFFCVMFGTKWKYPPQHRPWWKAWQFSKVEGLTKARCNPFKHAFTTIIIWVLKLWRSTEFWLQGHGVFLHRKRLATKNLRFILCSSCKAMRYAWWPLWIHKKFDQKPLVCTTC